MKNKGFALIEVIVSIVILSLVFATAVGLLYAVSTAVEKNRDRLTATYLAQECLEKFRNSRDTAWRNYEPWDCAWDSDDDGTCSGKNILDELTGEIEVNGEKTKFSREYTINEEENGSFDTSKSNNDFQLASSTENSAKITCTVSWGENDKLSISQILTNWRKY